MTQRVRSARETAGLIMAAQLAAPRLMIRAIVARREGRNVVLSPDEAAEFAQQMAAVSEVAERVDNLGPTDA